MSGLLFWHHDQSQFMWVFRDDEGGRSVAAVADDVIWACREEPGRSGLQRFLLDHGLLALPDKAFEFEEAE